MYKRERAGFVFQISLGIVERGSFVNACGSMELKVVFCFSLSWVGSEGEETVCP